MSWKTMLYGEHLCDHFSTVILCEGIFDMLRVNTACGVFAHCVASMGAQLTKEQILRLAAYPRRIICFDNDHAQDAAKEVAQRLSCFSGITEVVCIEGAKDPGSASDKDIARLLKFAGKL
jgi:DNA primase